MEDRNNRRVTEETYRKASYLWNAAAGVVNAAEAVVMGMIVTRVTGLRDAGALTIAFAVGNLLLAIGKYGIRNFQVSDIREQFRFADYRNTRIITTALMGICTAAYLIYASYILQYSMDKCMVVALICAIYMAEAVEDVYAGAYQFCGRLDLGAKIFCARWAVILMSFFGVITATKSIVTALATALFLSVIVSCSLIRVASQKLRATGETCLEIPKDRTKEERLQAVRKLLTTAFPLFGMVFLGFYCNNAPKYAIDRYLTDEVQACYGFVAMPVFVIELLNTMIYQPTIVPLTRLWKNGDTTLFRNRAVRQAGIVVLLTLVCVAGAAVIGIPVLSWLYHTDLTAYRSELLVLQGAGCFLALSGYLSVLLTIMRRQKALLAGYVAVAALSLILLYPAVRMHGTRGATASHLLAMLLLCIIYTGEFLYYLKREKT